MSDSLLIIVSLSAGLGLGVVVAWMRNRQSANEVVDAAHEQAKLLRETAERESAAQKKNLETAARDELLADRSEKDEALNKRAAKLSAREEKLADDRDEVADYLAQVSERDEELTTRHEAIMAKRSAAKKVFRAGDKLNEELIDTLEERAQCQRQQVTDGLGARWLEEARAGAAHSVRAIEQNIADSKYQREAERLLNVAVSRYQNHFLTERLISKVPIADGVAETLIESDELVLAQLQEVANVKLNLAEDGASVRLEGLDGVGREVARRALSKLSKKQKAVRDAKSDPKVWAEGIRDNLHREIMGLGRKAFDVLEIERAHEEIVDLVGRLNYRTSYTQNQWLHAVEASFLCGMIADEMGLDVKLARRATLMHDIGKALTHEIEGSHAVIGADIARRLGEAEVVANAIGAHHLDEPMNSVYAHLVAAADAMSGARPGARREQSEGFSTRIQDLERLAKRYRGVENCFAVHGGRELRVYVREKDVSDLQAVELSSEIAEQISEEMVFPGQIKVTVIRATEAVATTH